MGPECGKTVPTHWCHGHETIWVRIVHRECELRTCPRCAASCRGGFECPAGLAGHGGGAWAHDESRSAAARWGDYLEQMGLERVPIRQVVFAVPPERFVEGVNDSATVAKVRALAQAVVRRFAWRGRYLGSTVVHLWRGCEREGYNVWGPHAHVLCLGINVGKVAAYSARTGNVVKQVNGANGFASYRGWSLRRHLCYELGHAAILERGHALTWFGDLKKWGQPPERVGQRLSPMCPECHNGMEEWPLSYTLTFGLDGWEVQAYLGRGFVTRGCRVWDDGPSQTARKAP